LDLLQRGWLFPELNPLTRLGTLRDDRTLLQQVLDLADVVGLLGLSKFDLQYLALISR